MDLNSKYSGYRLDHPDFGDVVKTPYAKGIIKEVKKASDDPLSFESMAKVKINGVESDYLPIFYRPKEKYWDKADGILATDIDEEAQTYKRAWMSFRGDDEVAVLVKEGVPKAILGFADGVPRIGENIFKMALTTPKYWDVEKQTLYAAGSAGPDGKLLQLLRECTPITAQTETLSETTDYDWVITLQASQREAEVRFRHYEGTDGLWDASSDFWQVWIKTTNWETKVYSTYGSYRDHFFYLIPIGPILYFVEVFQNRTSKIYNGKTETEITGDADWIFDYECCSHIYYYPDPPYAPWDNPACQPAAEARAASQIIPYNALNYPLPDPWNYKNLQWSYDIYAAPFSQELYDRTKVITDTNNRPAEFIYQSDPYIHGTGTSLSGYTDPISIFARPHTKAELQAAGLWPKES
jgi:hypothetical protein